MPQHAGNFEVVQEIGRGGMAVVYLARQHGLDREVALKKLVPPAADSAFTDRFLREARVAAGLSHPNIVTVHEYFESDGSAFIAMEYVPGGSLRPYVMGLELAQIAGVLEGLLSGLAHAESRGIAHRDLKPENLMVTDQGTVKIADFGIARAYNQAASARLTATGMTLGTPTYMAPEQALGREVGPFTDLYSTGIVAYEMLVGRVPFEPTDTPIAILMRHVSEPPPPPLEANPDLDPQIGAWLDRMLAKDPVDRYQGAHRAWEDLEDIVIALLGPRWRRDARIATDARHPDAPAAPLTPAPFDDTTPTAVQRVTPPPAAAVTGYKTFVEPGGTAPPPPPAPPPAPPPPVEPLETAAVEPAVPAVTQETAALDQSAEPEPDPPARRRWPLVAAIAVITVAAGGGIAYALTSGGGSPSAGTTTGKSGHSTTTTTTTSTSTTTTGTSGSSGTGAPPPTTPLAAADFSLSYPAGWTADPVEAAEAGFTHTKIEDPASSDTSMSVDVNPAASGDPMAHATQVRADVVGYNNYQEQSFAQIGDAVQWVFTFDAGAGPQEEIDVFRTVNGKTYAIEGQSPEASFPALHTRYEQMLASFTAR